MADGPLTAKLRSTFESLTKMLADRAARERSIADAYARATAALEQADVAAREAAKTAIDAANDATAQRYTQDSTLARKRFDDGTALMVKTYEYDKGAIRERAESDLAKASKASEEAIWMAESLYDSSKDKPRQAFEAAMKERDAILAEATTVETAARQMLIDGRLGNLLRASVGTADEAEPVGAALARAQVETAKVHLTKLDGLFLPRVGGGGMLFVWVVVGTLAGAAAGMGAAQWQMDPMKVGIGAGCGLLVGAIFGLLLLRKAKSAAQRAAQPIVNAIEAARRTGEAWKVSAEALRAAQEKELLERHDREIESGKSALAKVKDEVTRSGNDRLLKLREKRDAEKTRLAQSFEAASALAKERRARNEIEVKQAFSTATAMADAARESAVAAAESSRAAEFEALVRDWAAGSAAIRGTFGEANETAARQFPTWDAQQWDRAKTASDPRGFDPPRVGAPATTIGTVRIDPATLPGSVPVDATLVAAGVAAGEVFDIPATLEMPARSSLLVQTGGEGRAAALAVLQNTMLRLLTAMPPGKVRFTIIDPVGLGQNFAGFMHLADYDPLLVNDKIWTEPRHIEARLTDLTEHMETVIQKYLRNQFASIEDYNTQAGEIAEPYRFLVIADLPTNFNELSAKRLASIIDSGARCGVYVLIAHDTRQSLPSGLSAQDLERAVSAGGMRLAWKRTANGEPGLVWDDPSFGPLPLALEAPPDEARMNTIIHMVGKASKDVGRVQVPFTTIAPTPERMWSLSTSADYHVPMGRAGATKLQEITLGRGTAQHALIAGRTGSGKSTLLHAIITNTALWYSPDEVEMYLVDFKKGVEFKTYAENAMPHARVIAIESEREFGLSVLRRLDFELKRRGSMFRDESVQDLAGFRAKQPQVRMPRVLLLVDEFQELFVEDDKLAQEAGLLLDRLVRQGRAFGMHVVLGSQTLGGAYSLAKATIGQMAVRIALQCSEADAYLIMGDDNAAPRLLSRPGEAIYNDQSGAVEGNSPFQVAWLPDVKRDEFLAAVATKYAKAIAAGTTMGAAEPTIIFEGSAPADISRNYLLNELLNRSQWPAPATGAAAWLGEAIAIKDPTSVLLRRQAASNLLIVGQQDEAATALLACSIVSLASQQPPTSAAAAGESGAGQFYVLDGTSADSTIAGSLARVCAVLPHAVRNVEYRQVEAVMTELAQELDRRQQAEADGRDMGGFASIYVVICGLQRFRMLRRAEDDFDFSSSGEEKAIKPDKVLSRLLREGPMAGMHVLTWCDTVGSLNRSLDRQALREFDSRVLFQMSQADSSALIDAATAGTIGQNRALFYSEEQGLIEKFRPWAMPDDAWLDRVRRAMKRGVGEAARQP